MSKEELLQIVRYAQEHNASDIHLASHNHPMIRLMGEIKKLRVNILSNEYILSLIQELTTDIQYQRFLTEKELDFAADFGDSGYGRFRANAFFTSQGPSLALRAIPAEMKSIDELGLPQVLKSLAMLDRGLVLITGATGSGKSTTLAAMIQEINMHAAKHILTIEDPLEFSFKSQKSLISQRELGSHTLSFAAALKAALREDPDVIMIGEMRDLETIRLALTAAETGHLVFGTLHTSSAAKTINRIVEIFPSGEQSMIRNVLSESLEGVISQRLLKRADGKGRVPALEVMLANSAIRSLIRDNKIPQIASTIQMGAGQGMLSLHKHLEILVKQELITEQVAADILNPMKSISDRAIQQQHKSVDCDF